tara:strand:+ start:2058 stop:2732 length:675 start_codon:yes stop_codon:yes gene_type:complete
MKINYKLQQGSEEWHELKYTKIGGTRAKSIMVKKGIEESAIFDEIMSERNTFYLPEEDSFISSAMQRGNDLEPLALENVEAETGIKFNSAGWISRNANHGHSPDGISECETIGLEVKCPSAKVHNSYVRNGVLPIEYACQVVNLFAMSDKIKSVYFASFNPDYLLMPLFLLEIKRTDEINISKKDCAKVSELATELNNKTDNLYKLIEAEESRIKSIINNKTKF